MDLELKDKVVMITGSTGGVGEALTKAFAAEGCKLAISSTKQEKLDKLVPSLNLPADHLLTFVVDVTKEEQVQAMVEKTIKTFGGLDVQVNNAGFEGRNAPITEQTYDDFMKVYNINVFGPMYGMKYAVRQMIKQKSGSIVNIASNGSFVGASGMSPYVSSKHAVAGLSKCVALETAASNIRVNCICPGAIDTPMMRSIEKKFLGENVSVEEAKKAFSGAYPDGRYANPEEVADLAVYLASARAGHITGACIRQDGGLEATSR
ncbi:SDR family oxidoreductase [Clostridium sp. KNHs216]|uniref:SDR family NAD(P)-dependent oxidoreductase n=1 Tax=Clostridium sp. KNHs216 TaxID=1550235 RepID=UPI001150C6D2|nr:SDR family oxidoreductase [Clostridium sp. KNHs216]TQI66834.1 NAD(P)-dependent dehydrogenase (short-subunit alcohol dehydrogenase family) [Clostridium sp. KNHs216]